MVGTVEATGRALPRRGTRIRESRVDRVFLTLIVIFLTFVLISVVYPLIFIVSSSFSSTSAVIAGRVWLFPVEPSLLGYQAVFEHRSVMIGYANSAVYTFFGTIINVVLTVCIAFPLSRSDFFGRNFLMMTLVFTMLFSGGLIPLYLVVLKLGLMNTRWAMLLPEALVVWFVIIARTYFQTSIPDELAEAASIDGCRDTYFVWAVVLPLSKPIVAVLTLMYAVAHWNRYFHALMFLSSERLYPLQIVLRNILILNQTQEMAVEVSEELMRQGLADLMKFSLIVVASAPVLALYPFVQRYFIKGIMIGSLKG